MTELPECGDGGWTLVMKINGAKVRGLFRNPTTIITQLLNVQYPRNMFYHFRVAKQMFKAAHGTKLIVVWRAVWTPTSILSSIRERTTANCARFVNYHNLNRARSLTDQACGPISRRTMRTPGRTYPSKRRNCRATGRHLSLVCALEWSTTTPRNG